MTDYETATEIEIAVARHIGTRTHTIVPNVSWGMFSYELDLCSLDNRTFYATEIEIKISKADLKRDLLKTHCHDRNHNMIKYLYFAMPEKMRNCVLLVPERAGILLVKPGGRVEALRLPTINTLAKKWSDHDAYDLARLASLRMWNLKVAVKENKLYIKKLRSKILAEDD